MSSYEQFITANEALFKCMEEAKATTAMSAVDQQAICRSEGEAVA